MSKTEFIPSMSIHIKELNINFENINLNNLTLLIGANGSGKSFILKMNWLINKYKQLKYIHCIDDSSSLYQFYYDWVFNTTPLNGNVLYTDYHNEVFQGILSFELINSKISNLNFRYATEPICPTCVFMSTDNRLFTNIEKFFKLYNSFNEDITELINFYKPYDVEINKLYYDHFKDGLEINDFSIFKNFDNLIFGTYKYMKVYLADDNATILIDYIDKNDEEKTSYLNTYSNGEQSILNMILCNRLVSGNLN